MVVLFATASGNPAIRDQETGLSSFIEELCKELRKNEKRTINQELEITFLECQNLNILLIFS